MTGYRQNDPRAPQADLGTAEAESTGEQRVWTWRTRMEGHTVVIRVPAATLRTVAYRAIRSLGGRARQGGITATVVQP